MENNLKKLEQTIGYQFTAKSLLEQAMTHSSYANEKHLGKLGCNERLEFLGDAVLELISSDFLYKKFRNNQEGELTLTGQTVNIPYCGKLDRLGWECFQHAFRRCYRIYSLFFRVNFLEDAEV